MKYISRLPKIVRNPNSHKGENGSVLVVGGSIDYVGAPALAALAALRSGVDLVTVAAPEKVALTINQRSYDLITKKLPGDFLSPKHFNEISKLAGKADVILIGNGMGLKNESKVLVNKILKLKNPKVIDADALKLANSELIEDSILTPHKKELEILLENNKTTLENISIKNSVIIKGKIDEVHCKGNILYNKTGNVRMTVGGTGDVLAGLCAGFLAQYKDIQKASITSIYLNGYIGDILLKEKGHSFTAEDMIDKIPVAIKNLGLVI